MLLLSLRVHFSPLSTLYTLKAEEDKIRMVIDIVRKIQFLPYQMYVSQVKHRGISNKLKKGLLHSLELTIPAQQFLPVLQD